ncbi:MAG: carboxylesterase family protein, partial [Oscillospiraceae bacterium]
EDEVSAGCNFEFAFAPVVDGDFLPVTPFESAFSPTDKTIPLIMGNVTDEGSMYAFSPIPFFPTTDATIEKFFEQNKDWDRNAVETLYGAYPAKRRKDKLGGDILFGVPCLLYADAYSKNAPVWMYRFAYHPIALRLKKLYTMHGTDMPFAFNNLKCTIAKQSLSLTLNKSAAERIKRDFSRELASFAVTGKASWEPYSESGRICREFNKKNGTAYHPLTQNAEVFKKTLFFKRKTELSKLTDTNS